MTNQPPERPDPFDAFETRLAARVTSHTEGGGQTGGPDRVASEAMFPRRLGWLLAGAALVVALIGGTAWAGSHGLFGAAPTPSPTLVAVLPTVAPSVAPTAPSTVAPIGACRMADLVARVTAWDGAAGNRIGTVVLSNNGDVACVLQAIERPQLVDGAGTVLIDGDDPSQPGSIEIAAGASVTAEVDDANYCGPDAAAPVSVAFVFGNGDRLVADAVSATDTTGLPDCLGPGGPGMIAMHPWAP